MCYRDVYNWDSSISDDYIIDEILCDIKAEINIFRDSNLLANETLMNTAIEKTKGEFTEEEVNNKAPPTETRFSGYSGYSMSNNAVAAYENGEKPLSKWTEKAVKEYIANDLDVSVSDITLNKPFREYLKKTSWHHTSSKYNKTDFYSVSYEDSDITLSKKAQDKINTQLVNDTKESLDRNIKALELLENWTPKTREDSKYIYMEVPYNDIDSGWILKEHKYSKEFTTKDKVIKSETAKVNAWIEDLQSRVERQNRTIDSVRYSHIIGNLSYDDAINKVFGSSIIKYDDTDINRFSNSKNILLFKNESQLEEFIDNSIKQKNYNKTLYFGKVSNNLAKRILNATNVQVENKNISISSNEIRKVIKDHGNEKTEMLRGQRAITIEDIMSIPFILDKADNIELNGEYNGKPVISFTFNNGGRIVVIGVDSDKSFKIFIQTMYANKKNKSLVLPVTEQAVTNTPEANRSTTLNDSKPQTEENVKDKFSTAISINDRINQSMTMAEAKRMLEITFNDNGIYDWYDAKYKNADEWLKEQGVDEAELYAENTSTVITQYIDPLYNKEDGFSDEYFLSDIFEAYLNKTLVGSKEESKTKRLNVSKDNNVSDNRFYAPHDIKGGQELYDIANQRVTNANRNEVYKARATFIINAHNNGYIESLRLTKEEVNKKLKSWANYPKKTLELSQKINEGVARQNQWVGLENSSIVNNISITNEELGKLVKDIQGDNNGWQRKYIIDTMLALDTHIDYSNLTFKFDKGAELLKRQAAGEYDRKSDTISIGKSGINTVAHEIGHYIDSKWARDLGINQDYLSSEFVDANKLSGDEKQFVINFQEFIKSISKDSYIGNKYSRRSSEYWQHNTEIFARFVAKFTEWVRNEATNGRYGYEEKFYKDSFNYSQYLEFAKLLQEKALLDSKTNDTRYSTAIDSQGNTLTQAQVDYFKDSKVRDENGNLLVVYHGDTDKLKTIFKATKGGKNSGMYEYGIFFTDNEEFADEFSYNHEDVSVLSQRRIGEQGKVYQAYLNITNPFIPTEKTVEELLKYGNEYSNKEVFEKALENKNDQLIKFYLDLEKVSQDYDGYIGNLYTNKDWKEYIAFNSNQVKSIDNLNPTESNDIRYSVALGMSEEERYKALKDVSVSIAVAENEINDGISNYTSGAILKYVKDNREALGIKDIYSNKDIDIDFVFSNGGIKKSVNLTSNRGYNLKLFTHLVSNLEKVLDNAVVIERHLDREKSASLLQVDVLVSAIRIGKDIYPVQFEVKELLNEHGKLYIAIVLSNKKIGFTEGLSELSENPTPPTEISIKELFSKVNKQDTDFFKYVPRQFLDEEYLELAKNPEKNKEELQKMVDNAAEMQFVNSKIRKADGSLRKVYHGTNNDDFNVFDISLLGNASGDSGYFGKGFYFTYFKGEAQTYGRNVKEAYLNIRNPFNFQKELNTYNGDRALYGYTPNMVFITNFAKKFKSLSDKYTGGVYSYSEDKEYTLSEFADLFENTYKTLKYNVDEYNGEYGEEHIVSANPEEKSFTNSDGKEIRWIDYGYKQRFLGGVPTRLEIVGDYLRETLDIVDVPQAPNIVMDTMLSDELIKRGYDGTLQSEDGDEVVAFYPNQIKSADPITYDDNGNIIPLSERFNPSNNDIRYSTTIDYDSLISKPDMVVSRLNDSSLNRKDTVKKARKSVLDNGGRIENGQYIIENIDTGNEIIIGKNGLEHSLTRDFESTSIIESNLGGVIKNAIKVNELPAIHKNATETYILLGYGENNKGSYSAYFVIDKLLDNRNVVRTFNVLYSVRGKKISGRVINNTSGLSLDNDSRFPLLISIKDLLDIVKNENSDILPQTVLDHFGIDRKQTELGEQVKYSNAPVRIQALIEENELLRNELHDVNVELKRAKKYRAYWKEQTKKTKGNKARLSDARKLAKDL